MIFADVIVPVSTSSTNKKVRGHWSKKSKEAAFERHATAIMLMATRLPTHTRTYHVGGGHYRTAQSLIDPPLPCTITLTRLSERELDNDNLAGALKHVRDEVAAWIGVDDRDPRVTWVVAQQKQKRGHFGVRLVVEVDEAAAVREAVIDHPKEPEA